MITYKRYPAGWKVCVGMFKLYYMDNNWRGFHLHIMPKSKRMQSFLGYGHKVYRKKF